MIKNKLHIGDIVAAAIEKKLITIKDVLFLFHIENRILKGSPVTEKDRLKRKDIKSKIKQVDPIYL